MSFLDVTLGNIALPDIRASFADDSLAGLLEPRPVSDRVRCGAAGPLGLLIGARVVRAGGTAMLVPASLGLLLPEVPDTRRMAGR